jgi:hypothetical protein
MKANPHACYVEIQHLDEKYRVSGQTAAQVVIQTVSKELAAKAPKN